MTPAERGVKDFLELVARAGSPPLRHALPAEYLYQSPAHWLLEHGRFWTPPATVAKGMAIKQCFHNAYALTRLRRGLRYVEGYAAAVFPVLHAWCVDADDQVIEPTWREPGGAYFGAVFTTAEVRARRRGSCEVSMIDNYEHGYPLLKVRRVDVRDEAHADR